MPLDFPRNEVWEAVLTTPPSRSPRYEPHENPSLRSSLGFGAQFSLTASATLLVTPVIVANESAWTSPYVVWMVFASLLVVGLSHPTTGAPTRTCGRWRGPCPCSPLPSPSPSASLRWWTGGPAPLTTLVLVSAVVQIAISKWLFILRRIVTPTVGGIIMMILSITLASVVFALLDKASEVEPTAAPLTGAGHACSYRRPHPAWRSRMAPMGSLLSA